MKIEEIRELKEMGFSNQEILQFATTGEVTRTIETKPDDQKPADQKPADQKPDDQKPDDQKPAENAEVTELKKTVSGMQEELKKFITSMQKNNLQGASFNMIPDDKTLEDKAIDSLSEIIRPKFKEEEKKK